MSFIHLIHVYSSKIEFQDFERILVISSPLEWKISQKSSITFEQ